MSMKEVRMAKKKVDVIADGTAKVRNHRNGHEQMVIVKDGKWFSPTNNKEWPEKLRKLYQVVGYVTPEPTKEAKAIVDGGEQGSTSN